jgi:hypothetical protein
VAGLEDAGCAVEAGEPDDLKASLHLSGVRVMVTRSATVPVLSWVRWLWDREEGVLRQHGKQQQTA